MSINDKIIDIIKNKKELLTKEEILEIINLIIKEEKLTDYVQNIMFDMSNGNCASYVRKNKLININYNEIINGLTNSKFKDSNLGKNIIILSIIFHEIEHVKQYIFIENSDNYSNEKNRLNIEIVSGIDEMIKRYEVITCQLGFISVFKYLDNLYRFNRIRRYYTSNIGYYSKLSEKQAEIKSLEKCQQLLNIINNNESKYINNEIEKEKNIVLLRGYKSFILSIKYPYKYFEKNIKYINPNNNINNVKNTNDNELSLEEKMMYGYSITRDEYKIIKRKSKN